MMYIKPYFFDDFHCKADKCSDTCCAGWEVDIDDDSYEKYKIVAGAFGERLTASIDNFDGQHCFKLCDNDRCVFLTQNGLCDIYSKLGKEYLCDICREHPRFYDYFDGITEMGLGLCCEKVCELIFASDEPVTFCSYTQGEDEKINEDDNIYFIIRENCLNIIYNRDKTLKTRICDLIEYGIDVQNELFTDTYEKADAFDIKHIFNSVIKLFVKTEPINDNWTEYVKSIESEFDKIFAVGGKIEIIEHEYEQLITYILYRHFMQSRFSGNILASICFSVISLIFIYLSDCKTFCDKKHFSHEDRINNVKLWSKQIEYSEENTQFLVDNAIGALAIKC